MTPGPCAVVVEDDPMIRDFVRTALEHEGWRVFDAPGFERGRGEVGARRPDLVLLDLGLPDGDGVDFVRRLRQWSSVPLIVISARTDERDKVAALDAGADDYLTKPFGVAELLARVRANLRRVRASGEGNRLAFGDVVVDLAARVVTRDGAELHLTPVEYRLLAHLVAHAGRVCTYRQLLADVWGPSFVESPHYVRIYMARLRRKLEDDPAQPRHLLNETGIGYRLRA
jgi:two-component system KDP operon response regulator KdpE